MYVVMPFNSDIEKLKQLESVLTASRLQQLADSTKYTGAVVLFPKMKIESSIDLKDPLRRLGVKSLFNPTEANLGLMSPGETSPVVPSRAPNVAAVGQRILSNFSVLKSNPNMVQASQETNKISFRANAENDMFLSNRSKNVDISERINSRDTETLDHLRQTINQQSRDNSYQNPGLYADKIIHKVYMDITETGTEAAASTSVTLSRDGTRVTFRADCPFFFFIRHEETQTILFWGSVNTPTPNY